MIHHLQKYNYTGCAKKSDTLSIFEFLNLLDALYLQFLFTYLSFSFMLFGVFFSNKSTLTESLLLSISSNRPLWKNGTSYHSASLTAALTNSVVVLLVLHSSRVDT